MLSLLVNPSLSAVLEAWLLTRLPGSPHLVMSWYQLHQQKGLTDLQHGADQKLDVQNAYTMVMQADAHAAGSAVPFEAEWLAKLTPSVNEHTSAARLVL